MGYKQRYDADEGRRGGRWGARLSRSRDGVFAGVCGGIADYFDVAPWAVRLIAVLLTFPFFFWTIVVYVILAFVLPKEGRPTFETYEDEEFWNVYKTSRSEALRKVNRAFESLDKRLQRMESTVTDPGFGMEDDFRKL